MTFSDVSYIDGGKHHATKLDEGSFYVAHPSMPGSPCAQHHLFPASVLHLRTGGAVRTSGHRYSLHPEVK